MNNTEPSPKLAVLIDADNASADIIEALLEEIAKYGIASVKRIYGDWSSGLKKWKNTLLPHAITPVQQFAYTKGKNATDMALVIDAMDLLYSNTFDGFCLVSSDSDFTRLASRLRENGLTVYGFGERKTPEAFRKACDKFVYTEIFQVAHKPAAKTSTRRSNSKQGGDKTQNDALAGSVEVGKIDAALLDLLYKAVKESADDLGWAGLGAVGSYVNKVTPDFDARNYGFSKFSSLIKTLEQFETQADNNQLKIRKTNVDSSQKAVRTALKPTPVAPAVASAESANSETPRRRGRPAKAKPVAKPSPAPALKPMATRSIGRLIALVQQAAEAVAGADGWAQLGSVAKQLPQTDSSFTPQQYGFNDPREAIRAIYADWLEIKKAGRGERVRINKRFVLREEREPSATAASVDAAGEEESK